MAYTREQETQAADALDGMSIDNIIRALFMPDYGRLRAQARACRGEKP